MKRSHSNKARLIIYLCPFAFLFSLHCLGGSGMRERALSAGMAELSDTFVISGKVVKKQEVWDRRTNPEMGRPDILTEVVFYIRIASVIRGNPLRDTGIITASVKGQEKLIRFKGITNGSKGTFKLNGDSIPFQLLHAEISEIGKDTAVNRNHPGLQGKSVVTQKENTKDSLTLLEKKSGREMKTSKQLQEACIRHVARKYGMKNGEFVTLTSFSGPAPPEGGYIYWGVRGKVKGKWRVWQAGKGGKLMEGKELDDPQKYMKCNSPYTKILTPTGATPISSLKKGDSVISGGNKSVPILQVIKVRAVDHRVCRVTFDKGPVIEISPGHALADGRLFGALKTGDIVNGRKVMKNVLIDYRHKFTWDILPDSPTGTYFFWEIEISSTIKPGYTVVE